MNKVDLDKYYQDTFSLARTMIIKMNVIAQRDNQVLTQAGYAVSSDQTTWRYYMNLNGDYHPTDDVMTVTSVDTGEEIIFNKANLAINLATYREYAKIGSRYNRLMELYPHQTALINGIIFPIPYTTTISADDYKILSYDTTLVLWNEDQLIPKLQSFMNASVRQLLNHDYVMTDDLFLPVMVKVLYADLIKAIMNIRLADAYTRHTHDFLIWSHIDSFGAFSQYKDSLTQQQTMWLFRNIAWIRNNPGKQYTLDKMLNNLLTTGNIPLAKYEMVSTTQTQVVDLTPTPLYRRTNMNLLTDYGKAVSFITTEQITTKESTLASDNPANLAIYTEDALVKGTYSLNSELPTKVLESSMQDYTNRHIDTQMTVAYNEWIYLAGKGAYTGNINVTDPTSGKTLRFPVTDAYNLWRYLVLYSQGNTLETIEPAYYQDVLKLVAPAVADIINIGGPSFIGPILAGDIRNLWITAGNFVSPDYLMEYANSVYDIMWSHKKQYSQFYDLNKRARVEASVKFMYESGEVMLGGYTTYNQLFSKYELVPSSYSATDAQDYAWAIFKAMTGWDTNSQPSARQRQSDLIDIMLKLSSYTIQIVKEMNDGTNQTELVNETFVGDSKTVGLGNRLRGDFHNVQLDVHSNLDTIAKMKLDAKVYFIDILTFRPKMTMDVVVHTPTKQVLKLAPNEKSLWARAIRFPSNGYVRLLPPSPIVDTIIPPTDYGVLDPAGTEPVWAVIPPTDYGPLNPDIPDDAIIPPTDYQTLGNEVDNG
jgi:hypothetical protein